MIHTSVTESVRILGTVDDWYPRRTLEPAPTIVQRYQASLCDLDCNSDSAAGTTHAQRERFATTRTLERGKRVGGSARIRGNSGPEIRRMSSGGGRQRLLTENPKVAPARNRVRRRRKVKSASVVVGAEQREEGRGRARRLPRPSLPPASCDLLRTLPPHSHLPLASPPSSAIQYSLVRTSLA